MCGWRELVVVDEVEWGGADDRRKDPGLQPPYPERRDSIPWGRRVSQGGVQHPNSIIRRGNAGERRKAPGVTAPGARAT